MTNKQQERGRGGGIPRTISHTKENLMMTNILLTTNIIFCTNSTPLLITLMSIFFTKILYILNTNTIPLLIPIPLTFTVSFTKIIIPTTNIIYHTNSILLLFLTTFLLGGLVQEVTSKEPFDKKAFFVFIINPYLKHFIIHLIYLQNRNFIKVNCVGNSSEQTDFWTEQTDF